MRLLGVRSMPDGEGYNWDKRISSVVLNSRAPILHVAGKHSRGGKKKETQAEEEKIVIRAEPQ